ncbi:MAG: hypothetical protein KME22_04435 [Hassallia sp. WJT32-NPBG1]|jgi:hypothetical protein|nr:hypothetical protein [Spirirestis rafaelensis WJT71-NPBG6]MBW4606477.1 hypothetical protein [Hassallia sp. WJT32-NPBG1]
MQTVVKLTPESVLGEIESVLDTYPYNPYQQAFAIPDLREELISFVLSRIPCLYSTTEDNSLPVYQLDQECLLNFKLPRSPLEQTLYLQNLIHQGISSIMKEKSDWISDRLCDTVQVGSQPSYWFG